MSRSQENALLGHLKARSGRELKARKGKRLLATIAGIIKASPAESEAVIDKLAQNNKLTVVRTDGHVTLVKFPEKKRKSRPKSQSTKEGNSMTKVKCNVGTKKQREDAEAFYKDATRLLDYLQKEASKHEMLKLTQNQVAKELNFKIVRCRRLFAMLRNNDVYTCTEGPNPVYLVESNATVTMEMVLQFFNEKNQKDRARKRRNDAALERSTAKTAIVTSTPPTERPSKADINRALIDLGALHIKLRQEFDALQSKYSKLEEEYATLAKQVEHDHQRENEAVSLILKTLGGNE